MIRYRGALPVLMMTSGLIVWASCFAVLYAALSLGCTYGPPAMSIMGVAGLTWILCFLWIVHLLVLGWLIAHTRRLARGASTPTEPGRFALRTALMLQVVGLLGSIWIGFPILMLPTCL